MATKQRVPKQKKMRTIGRWYIGETLGKGGYSWVKKGFDKKTGKCVALKFMAKADESWAKEQSKQVITEIESLKQIRHPNVMKLYAYNLNARYPTKKKDKIDTVLLVLEFAPGGEIFDILYYTSALEPVLARTYLRQSIFGLEACHNAGVAHRDIKPQNLLLDSRFNIKLTDFGLSKVFESDADAVMKTTYVGTRGYQAPELLLDQQYDLQCDVFSMGVVLFILITGYPPFEQAHYSDRWFRPLTKSNPGPDTAKFWKNHSGCSISDDEDCKDLLQRMLCAKPKQRITIKEMKEHPWFTAKHLEGKELIRALRQRHREMEAKRRRDARKIKDLQVSITPNRSLSSPEDVPFYPSSAPEEISSNTYAHHKGGAKDFFGLLHGLVAERYSGSTTYEPDAKPPQMTCHVSKMEKSQSAKKTVQSNYKFVVQLYRSAVYRLPEVDTDKAEQKADNVDVDDLAQAADDAAHTQGVQQNECVYVVTIKRLEGDDWKFRSFQKKLLCDGALAFNGLPQWVKDAKLDEQADAEFEKKLLGLVPEEPHVGLAQADDDGKQQELAEEELNDAVAEAAEKEMDAEYANYDWKDEAEDAEVEQEQEQVAEKE